MAVSRKPLRPTPVAANSGAGQGITDAGKSTPPRPRPGVDVDAIIGRGGSVARDTAPPAKARKSVLLNLPHDTVEAIAKALAKRPVKITRQTWIEEAIAEKLENEG